MRLLTATIIAASLSALAALPAQATICRNQPGQGAIDQYCEIIPSGAGERPDRTGRGGSPAASLPAKTREALRAAGAEGAAVAALASSSPAPQLDDSNDQASSGGGSAAGDEPAGKSGSTASASEPAAPSSGTLDALVSDVGGTGGRSWLPWALLAIGVAAGLSAWLRRGRWS